MDEFVHLHVHTEYSLREGALRIHEYIEAAVDMGMSVVSMTDTNAMYGAVPFYRAAKAAGLKPIIGVQLSVARDEDTEKLAGPQGSAAVLDTAVFLAEDFSGYQNLVRLVSLAHQKNRIPFVTFSELHRYSEKVIALIAGGESLILRQLSEGRQPAAQAWLQSWKQVWPQRSLFIDIQDHGIPEERKGLPALVKAARELNVPLVATNDVHYLQPEDADVQKVLSQIESGLQPRVLTGNKYHLATPEEMEHRFSKLPQAIENALKVAERCNLDLPIGRTLQPKYPTQTGESSEVVLRRAAEAGLKQRYTKIEATHLERLEYELGIIESLGFADYFLVVADFIRFAHKNGISTGPGRGSAAGSLIAYVLRITDVDPISNQLLFERFLNPERVSWPDIDTDFEYERRNEVIRYVVDRYGVNHVAQIGTFGTLAARAAIRDAGRVLQTDPKLVDRIAKLIPSYPGITLHKAITEVSALAQIVDDGEAARVLWDTACKLEGFPRHTSIHAAGVVISPIPLTDIVPLQQGADGVPVTQYSMEDVEKLGLMKMDFLGLRTLTLIDTAIRSIEQRTGTKFDWRRVSNSDRKTYEMLSRGETEGCFQLESSGVRRVLRDLKPSQLEDLIAVISLYRPGPMENIPAFIAAKHGRSPVHYPHPDLEPILRDTYGVIVYQEQIMQIASLMAGFSLGQADLLRRAVGKKQRDVLDAERSRFVQGCEARGYSTESANDVYNLIVRFADYGFNRSHAAAYAVLAFRTSYLRANHTADFFAALLTMAMGSQDKVEEYIRDAKRKGVQVLLPSVQRSQRGFHVESDTQIRTGLLAIRNVGNGAVEAILQAREQGPFESLVDFLKRVNRRTCNQKAVESLLTAGALSDFVPEKASSDVALQILQEAYAAVEEQHQTQGLGLDFTGRKSHRRREQMDTQHPTVDVLYIRYDAQKLSKVIFAQIQNTLKNFPGDTRVALYDTVKRGVRLLQPTWSVTLTPELITVLEDLVGLGNARVGTMPK